MIFSIQRLRFGLLTASALALLGAGCSRPTVPGLVIDNPYRDVNWETDGRHRANFHTHSTGSDGNLNPHDVIDRYHALGYSILALTDHNTVTYPWTSLTALPPSSTASNRLAQGRLESESLARENRDPAALGMIAIQGNELSSHHHMGSFYTDHNGTDTEVASLEAVGAKGGLTMLYHPGRYRETVEWYVDLYRRFPHLIGLEVFNQGDRYPTDRATWDAILTALMPERTVWGYSNDDMHAVAHLGRNYNVMLLPELSDEWVRRGMQQGRSWFVYNPEVSAELAVPLIESIRVDDARGRIEIQASGPRETLWISEGAEIHRGDAIDLSVQPRLGRYVRAELRGENGVTVATQPFGVSRPARVSLTLAAAPGAVEYAAEGQVRARVHVQNLTERSLRASIELRLDDQSLLRRRLKVPAGATVDVPLTLPASALNSGRELVAEIDLGAEYGALRRYPTLLPLEVELPVTVEIDAPSLHYARLRVRNRLADRVLPIELVASIDGEEIIRQKLELPADGATETRATLPAALTGQAVRIEVSTRWAPDAGPTDGHFAADLDFQDTAFVPRRPEPAADSAPAWGDPLHTLDSLESVTPESRRERWQGAGDASVGLQWFWGGDHLWIAADVRDDSHANTRDGGEIWNGDALQIGIAPIGVEAVNFALALTDKGVQFYQWRGVDRTLAAQAEYSVARDDTAGITRYRLRLPLTALGLAPEPGLRFGLNAVVFDDDDGTGHDFWLQMTPGLAGGWDPARFKRFALGE